MAFLWPHWIPFNPLKILFPGRNGSSVRPIMIPSSRAGDMGEQSVQLSRASGCGRAKTKPSYALDKMICSGHRVCPAPHQIRQWPCPLPISLLIVDPYLSFVKSIWLSLWQKCTCAVITFLIHWMHMVTFKAWWLLPSVAPGEVITVNHLLSHRLRSHS